MAVFKGQHGFSLKKKTIIFLVAISLAGLASLLIILNRTERLLAEGFRNEEMRTVENFILGTLKPVMLSGHGNIMPNIMASYKNNIGIKDLKIIRTNGVEAFMDGETMGKVNARLKEEKFKRDIVPAVQALPTDDPRLKTVLTTEKKLTFDTDGGTGESLTTMMLPIMLEERCKACHGDDHRIRGVLIASFGMTDFGRDTLKQISQLTITTSILALMIIAAVFIYISWTLTGRISRTVAEVNDIVGHDRFDQRISVDADDEIGELAISFNHFISSVEIYREEEAAEKERLEKTVRERTKELREKNDFIENDLKHARRIQQRLMPEKFPELADVRFHAEYRPCLHIGGDYYDVFEMANGHVGIFMADASGHGSSAALLVSIVKAVVSTVGKDINSPGYVVSMINNTLSKLTPDDSFVTLFYGILDLKTGKMLYSLAGHPQPAIHNRRTGSVETLKVNGGLVGIFDLDQFLDSEYTFKAGDRFLVYTDGLVEATKAGGREQFGKDRVIAALVSQKEGGPKEAIDTILSAFDAYTGGEALADDVTIMAVDYGNA